MAAKVAQYSAQYLSEPVDLTDDENVVVKSITQRAAPSSGKVGIMLLNLGGPDSIEDVQPFLENLFGDPDIIRLPRNIQFLQPFIAKLISSLRAPKSAQAYESIGGGSPLKAITVQQGEALAAALDRRGVDSGVYVAMRYWHPYTEEAIEQIKRDKIKELVILPLYPQFSISTSGSSLRLLEQIFRDDIELAGLQHTVIPSWYSRPGYVTAMADLIQTELNTAFGSSITPDVRPLLLSPPAVPSCCLLLLRQVVRLVACWLRVLRLARGLACSAAC